MALSHTGASLDEIEIFPTDLDFSKAMGKMKKVSDKFANGEKFRAVAGGVRAYNKKTGQLFDHPHFPMWVGEPLLEKLKAMFNSPVHLENDAALVGLGEAVYGAGKGEEIVAYITLSTGVGGARIVGGKLDRTHYGFEPGNMIISENEYLEELISGKAIEKRYGKKISEIEDENVWDEVSKILAIGLNNIAVLWSPDVIVLGGSVPNKLKLTEVSEELKKVCKIYPEIPDIKLVELDEKGGLYGGLAYLRKL